MTATINNSPFQIRNAVGLSAALKEAADNHHAAEKRLPAHDWNDWYAAFIFGRAGGMTTTEAADRADTAVRLKVRLGTGEVSPPADLEDDKDASAGWAQARAASEAEYAREQEDAEALRVY